MNAKNPKSVPQLTLTSVHPTHEQIAQRAHQIWLFEGRPTGRERQHWIIAEALLQAEIDCDLTRRQIMARRHHRQTIDNTHVTPPAAHRYAHSLPRLTALNA